MKISPASPAPPSAAEPLDGWQARLELRFARDGATTRLVGNRHSGPLRLLKPLTSDDGLRLDAVIVHPPGGLVGGDRLSIDVEADAGSAVLLTTPGAQKWYRPMTAATATVETRLRLGDGAAVDWLPQPSILFDGARANQSLSIAMASTATCVGWEMLVRGRAAMGERWQRGRIEQTIEVTVGGVPRWRQRLVAGADDRSFDSPLGWCGHGIAASIWYCAPASSRDRLAAVRDRWRALIAAPDRAGSRVLGAATQPGDGLVLAQLLGDDAEALQGCCAALWRAARRGGPAPDADPRIWRT
jgi:urease accessory protein